VIERKLNCNQKKKKGN